MYGGTAMTEKQNVSGGAEVEDESPREEGRLTGGWELAPSAPSPRLYNPDYWPGL
jgi:hypothetical protein